MTKIPSGLSTLRLLSRVVAPWLVVCSLAYGQLPYLDHEIRVHGLPSLMARTHDPSDVLLTSLDTIIHEKGICCGKDSAIEDSALAANPKALKDVADKLKGRHLLSDGRPIMVTTEFLTRESANSGHLIRMILDQHAALIEWNSHVYVLHGVDYIWTYDEGVADTMLHNFLLWDTRYSDSRREVTLTLGVDDTEKIQGLLFVQTAMQ